MTTDQQHTPEPWHIGLRTAHSKRDVYGPQGELIALADACLSDLATAQANARRIVACVNACAGIPSDMLEKVSAGGIERSMQAMAAQRDELANALRELCADKYLADPINNDRMAKARAALATVAA